MWLSALRKNLLVRPPQAEAGKRRRKIRRLRSTQGRLRLEQLEERSLLSFNPVVQYGVGTFPQAVATGDFNGDNRADIVTANQNSANVSVLLNNGDNTFQGAQNYAVGSGPHSVAVGDFNRDGKLDVVTANSSDLSVLLGNGDGTFAAAQSIALPGQFPPGYMGTDPVTQNPLAVAVGDLDKDGKLDLVVTARTSFLSCPYYCYDIQNGYDNVLLGHGDGTFADAAVYQHNDSNPQAVALADLNGDGNLDVVTNNSYGASSLLGNGDGTLQPAKTAATGGYGFSSVALGDLDRDGKLDLVIQYPGLSIWKGQGDGTFQQGPTVYLGTSASSVAVGDLNADGKLDLTAITSFFTCTSIGYDSYGFPYCNGGFYTGQAQVLMGYGDGNFAAPNATNISGSFSGVATLADLNGDGLPDLATANYDATASVAFNAGDFVLPPPSLSISDVTVTEGNTGTVNAVFTVTLSASWDQTITVLYATADNTATTADNDYLATSGTLTFDPGVTSQTVTVVVNGDRRPESDESFFVNLDSATVAPIADAQAVGTILNDEPNITIADVSGTEGNSGTTNFVFTVNLSAAYDQTVTVHYSTADGTATTAGSDYVAASGTLTFDPGVTSQTVTVVVKGDRLGESDETFFVNLDSASSYASIADAQGVGTIFDDEPHISINDVSGNEGKAGATLFRFTVSLSVAYDQMVTVNYSTADGTATTADKDYRQSSGRLVFRPGSTSQSIAVLVRGDRKVEPDETFFVNLSGASSNALIVDSQGVGTIVNDDSTAGASSPRSVTPASDTAALLAAVPTSMTGNHSAPVVSGLSRHLSTPVVDRVFSSVTNEKREVISSHARPRRVERPQLGLIRDDEIVF
jgi:hypothetical protein